MLLYYVLIIYSCHKIFHTKDLYDMQADELMDVLLNNVYKGRFQQSNPNFKSTTKIPKLLTTKETLTTSKSFSVTKHYGLKKYAENMTMSQFNLRKLQRDINNLVESNVSPIPNFDATNDEIDVETRRFNKLRESANKENALRQLYFDYENGTFIYVEKNRTVSLMAQFVYETHYNLPYAQILRSNYINDTRYQIGYCFSLLRTLKRQQMMIYNTMVTQRNKMPVLFTHIKWYEKILRLHIDIKDVIKLIQELDKIREAPQNTTTITP